MALARLTIGCKVVVARENYASGHSLGGDDDDDDNDDDNNDDDDDNDDDYNDNDGEAGSRLAEVVCTAWPSSHSACPFLTISTSGISAGRHAG